MFTAGNFIFTARDKLLTAGNILSEPPYTAGGHVFYGGEFFLK